jgi:hypothetical protein
MNRAVLITLGAFVAIAGIVLAILIAKSDGDESHAANGTTTGPGGQTTTGPQPGSLSREAPTLPGGVPVQSGGDPNKPRDYAVGDVHIRDHREGTHAPLDIPPNVHPAEGRKIPSTLTHEISAKVLDVLKTCAADLPADQRGEKPRLEGQIEISIKSGKTRIDKATMQPRGVTEGPAATAFKACMEQKSIGIQNNAPDQEDLETYTINLSYAVP